MFTNLIIIILKVIDKIRSRFQFLYITISSRIGDFFKLNPKVIDNQECLITDKKRILIIGVALGDRKNHYNHISSTLSKSERHEVQQVWAILKSNSKMKSLRNVKHIYIDEYIPRTKLINSLFNEHSDKQYDFIIIVDDDIRLHNGFLDKFINMQDHFDFSIAQPARTIDSTISHEITRQRPDLLARQTLFVEIGPLVSIRHDAQKLILPLDERSPMGWGLDYVWPHMIQKNNMKMGIIDSVPVAHTLRPVGESYKPENAYDVMVDYLQTVEHLNEIDAHIVLKNYSKTESVF